MQGTSNVIGVMSRFRVDLSKRRINEILNYNGRFLKVFDASSYDALALIGLEVSVEDGDKLKLQKNVEMFDVDGFQKLIISNEAQAGEWIEVFVSQSREDFYYDNPGQVAINSITEPVAIAGGKKAQNSAISVSTSASQVISADDDRRTALIQNLGTGDVYIGVDNTLTTSNGIKLASGESFETNTRDDIWMVSASGSQDVRIWLEEKN